MFVYQKKLQYPVRIKNTNPKLAALIISQYGGPECVRVQGGQFKNFYRLLNEMLRNDLWRGKISLLQ